MSGHPAAVTARELAAVDRATGRFHEAACRAGLLVKSDDAVRDWTHLDRLVRALQLEPGHLTAREWDALTARLVGTGRA